MSVKTKKQDDGFLTKIFGGLFAGNDPEAEKRRALKQIAKQLAKTRYKFYKISTKQVLPPLAKYFYDIYKAIAPAQAMLANAQTATALKNCIIDYMMSDEQKNALGRLSEEHIREQARTLSVKELNNIVKRDMQIFTAGFDAGKVALIDALYQQFGQFVAFINFDYYFLLKKFDSNFHEREFATAPNFVPTRSDYLIDDLKDFIAVAWVFKPRTDWSKLFAFIKAYKQNEPIPLQVWNKVMNRVSDLRMSRTLEMMIACITEDPYYEAKYSDDKESVVDVYLKRVRVQIEGLVQRIASEKANSKTDQLLKALFGTTDVIKLKNYTDKANEYFEKRSLPRYLYCAPLNYMKAFLIDYFKKDVRIVSDLVLVRGKWRDAALSQEMSNAYNNILGTSDRITTLDNSLGDDVDRGSKIRLLSSKAERDKAAIGQLQASFKNVNAEAFALLKDGSKELVTFAKVLKLLIEDVEKAQQEVLSNWKEVQHNADAPLKQLLIDVYKKIYNFIALMQTFLADNKGV